MAELKILNLKKEYEKGKTAVDEFTLTIPVSYTHLTLPTT